MLTQLCDIVHVSGMTQVYTDPKYLFDRMGRIADDLGLQEQNGIGSVLVIAKILDCKISDAEALLKTLHVLKFCFPISSSRASFSSVDGSLTVVSNESQDYVWMFPCCRREGSSRGKTMKSLEASGQLEGLCSRYGLRFSSQNGFLPPVLLSLVEFRLRSVGVVLEATQNTLIFCTTPDNRVLLHYDTQGETARLDCAACCKTEAQCHQVLALVSVCITRSADVYFPQLVLQESALCIHCLNLEQCCAYPIPRGLQLGEYVIAESEQGLLCARSRIGLRWKDIIPTIGQQSHWRQCWHYDVMISHAGEDTPLALDVYKWLTHRGVRCFLDEMNLSHTSDADNVVPSAMDQCRFCVCIVTHIFCKKRWPIQEYKHFHERETAVAQRSLLPILVDLEPDEFIALAWEKCQWTSHGAMLALNSQHDVNGEGRVDIAAHSAAFSVKTLFRLCDGVTAALDQARCDNLEKQGEIGPLALALTPHGDCSDVRSPSSVSSRRQEQHIAFLSHASEDKAVARRIAHLLHDTHGLSVFVDDESIRGGEEIRGRIYQEIRNSRAGIFVLTETFFSKPWPQLELNIFRYEAYISDCFGRTARTLLGVVPYREQWPEFLEQNSLARWITTRRAFTSRDWIEAPRREGDQETIENPQEIVDQRETGGTLGDASALDSFSLACAKWLAQAIRDPAETRSSRS